MPLYHYRAADQDGRIVKGAVEALHESDLEAQLKNLGLSLMRAKVIKSHHRSVKNLPPAKSSISCSNSKCRCGAAFPSARR